MCLYSALCLSVFPRNLHIPWVGNVSDLATLSQPDYFPIPLKTVNGRGYSNKPVYPIPYVNQDLLQV